MVNEKKLVEALKEYIKNPTWADCYKNAPTESCKRYIALGFYNGTEEDAKDVRIEKRKIEERMDSNELRYVLKWTGNNPVKGRLMELLEKK